jgi:CubicO group peptidase (beta-lactamase class C family)
MAASNTKGMTTLLLAELVDEKKLKWDEPVVDVYPAFKPAPLNAAISYGSMVEHGGR